MTLSSGMRKLNDGSHFGTGSTSATFNINLDYGNPFEKRSRKPFDYFKMRTDFNLGVGRKILDNINGLGILTGNNSQHGSLEILTGLFQHYDFWDNKTFELGAITLGGGVGLCHEFQEDRRFQPAVGLWIELEIGGAP